MEFLRRVSLTLVALALGLTAFGLAREVSTSLGIAVTAVEVALVYYIWFRPWRRR